VFLTLTGQRIEGYGDESDSSSGLDPVPDDDLMATPTAAPA
jgi:hypothetical protein